MAASRQTNLVLRPAGTETMHRTMAGFICAVSAREWGPGVHATTTVYNGIRSTLDALQGW